MINGKSILAIIPARGGSKRLPRKNVIDLAGKPLIAWTIEAALGCSFIDEVIVTTDDVEIAEVSKRYGASVPFMRPAIFASDTATSFDTIKHAIDFYRDNFSKKFDLIVLLQPTSPLRSAHNIYEAIELLEEKSADAVVSVCETDHSPLWMNTLPNDLSMNNFLRDDVKNIRSQDLPRNYRLNGAIYICQADRLVVEKSFIIFNNIFAYIMNKDTSVDIDDSFDLKVANFLFHNR